MGGVFFIDKLLALCISVGMEFHRLSNVDLTARTAICSICGPVKIKAKGRGTRTCYNKFRENKRAWYKTDGGKTYVRRHAVSYRKFVKPVCEICGFKAFDVCLMDGHHKDGNRKNNSVDNIQSLCPMCHRMLHLGLTDGLSKCGGVPDSSECTQIKKDNLALLNDISNYEVDVAELKGALAKCEDSNLDDKASFWRNKYLETVKPKSEYDQS